MEAESCWDTAVTVDDVESGEDDLTSWADARLLWGDWTTGRARAGSTSALEGLLPATGLQAPELLSGHRNTSMGPRELLRDTW